MLDLCGPADSLISTPISDAAGLTGKRGPKHLGRKNPIFLSPDEEILTKLGCKQEFKRAFSAFEVFGISFWIIGLSPSISSVLIYAAPNGGPSAMVWGVRRLIIHIVHWYQHGRAGKCSTNIRRSTFFPSLLAVRTDLMARCPNFGSMHSLLRNARMCWRGLSDMRIPSDPSPGSLQLIGCSTTNYGCRDYRVAGSTIYSYKWTNFRCVCCFVFSHALLCSLGTTVLARVQNIYIVASAICYFPFLRLFIPDMRLSLRLCLPVIFAIPVATPKEFHNRASYALGNFPNSGLSFSFTWVQG